ncbi:MAG TPA: hypothetical protein VFR50_15445, partial [Casimicrobiaceae bacterium]|nr:hypothetical protein [Casimicrobiaceae bacterium]
APEEEKHLAEIERLLKRNIPVLVAEGVTAASRSSTPTAHREHRRPRGGVGQPAPRAAHPPAAQRHSEAVRPHASGAPSLDPHSASARHASNRAPSPALTTPGAPPRPGDRKPKPVAALLMKRRVSEPESA